MGKKKHKTDKSTTAPGNQHLTLREENCGRKSVSASSMLKLEHLQKIATWASSETSMSSLAALFGQRLSATAKSVGVPLERTLFICQRCETVLHPGDNCTIRIESNHAKSKRKSIQSQENNVAYMCHFCSHCNLLRGTAKGCVKEILRSRVKRFSVVKEACKKDADAEIRVPVDAKENSMALGTPITPCSLLSMKKTRSLGATSCGANSSKEKNSIGFDGINASGGSSKRKRKQWSSLKEIVEKNEIANKVSLSSLVIPLKL